MSKLKLVLAGSMVVALAIVGCGKPKSGVSKENKEYYKETKGAPKWVTGDLNDIYKSNKEYSGVFLGRGQDDIVDGDVSYATTMATTRARVNIAANLKTELTKEVEDTKTREGGNLTKVSSVKIGESVDKVLTATKKLAEYVGKDRVWVLVGIDQSIVAKVRAELGMRPKNK